MTKNGIGGYYMNVLNTKEKELLDNWKEEVEKNGTYHTLYYIMDINELSAAEGDGEPVFYLTDEWERIGDTNEFESYIKANHSEELSELEEEVGEIDWEYSDDIEMLCEKFDITILYYHELHVKKDLFLTKKDAEDYLLSNKHHLHANAYISEEKLWDKSKTSELLSALYTVIKESD